MKEAQGGTPPMLSTSTSLSKLRDLFACCSGFWGVVGNRRGKRSSTDSSFALGLL